NSPFVAWSRVLVRAVVSAALFGQQLHLVLPVINEEVVSPVVLDVNRIDSSFLEIRAFFGAVGRKSVGAEGSPKAPPVAMMSAAIPTLTSSITGGASWRLSSCGPTGKSCWRPAPTPSPIPASDASPSG